MTALIRELNDSDFEEMKALFRSVFTAPPWNDDWSDEHQLDEYLRDLTGVRAPLALGLFENDAMIGLSLGYIKHWYSGTEYVIDELCIRPEFQRKGYGREFLAQIEQFLISRGIRTIFLTTERNVPAFSFYKKLGFTELPEYVGFYKAF